MELTEFLNYDMIWAKIECTGQDELFELVAKKGEELDFVTENFLSKIKQRECTFPTGLKLENYGVAIPHTDPEHIKKQFISILTTRQGIPFNLMEDASRSVNANLIFVLGLNESDNQLKLLQQLMKLFQNEENIDALVGAESAEEIKAILEKIVMEKK